MCVCVLKYIFISIIDCRCICRFKKFFLSSTKLRLNCIFFSCVCVCYLWMINFYFCRINKWWIIFFPLVSIHSIRFDSIPSPTSSKFVVFFFGCRFLCDLTGSFLNVCVCVCSKLWPEKNERATEEKKPIFILKWEMILFVCVCMHGNRKEQQKFRKKIQKKEDEGKNRSKSNLHFCLYILCVFVFDLTMVFVFFLHFRHAVYLISGIRNFFSLTIDAL